MVPQEPQLSFLCLSPSTTQARSASRGSLGKGVRNQLFLVREIYRGFLVWFSVFFPLLWSTLSSPLALFLSCLGLSFLCIFEPHPLCSQTSCPQLLLLFLPFPLSLLCILFLSPPNPPVGTDAQPPTTRSLPPSTGPFFRYRTYLDWLEQPFPGAVPSLRPLLRRAWPAPLFGLLFLLSSHLFPLEAVREDAFYARPLPTRLFYMIPVFFAFRMRFYVAWIAAECGCIAAGFGAYPVAAKARAGGGPTLQCPPPSRSGGGREASQDPAGPTTKGWLCP